MENDRYPIEITHVIDGDGFMAKALDGSDRAVEVRLYAIDAPEGSQKYGQEATNHLRQVVENGRLWLQVIGEPDPNGRTVAVVYKDSLETSHTLNYLMVRAGWAYWYSHYEDGGNELGLKEAEATAYMEGVGVWQEPGLERPWTFKERMRQEAKERACQEKLRQEAEEEARREVEEERRPLPLALTPEKERRLAEAKEIQDGIARRRRAEERERR